MKKAKKNNHLKSYILSLLSYILSLLSFFPFSFTMAQHLEIQWQQCYGGSEDDFARDIVETTDGYLIVGNTKSDNGDISYLHGGTDVWLIKTDSLGSLLWEKTYGGTNGDGCHRIIKDNSDNYYLVGASDSSDGDISYDPYPDTWDFWIVKIDSLGNILWEKIVGGNGDETQWTATATEDGGVVALGWTGSDDGDVSTYYGAYDMWMVKLNSEGDVEWDFTIGNNWFEYGQAIIQTSDGGFLVGGTAIITGGGNLDCVTHGEGDAVLVKLDAQRNIEWQRCYGGSDHDGVYGILEMDDGYMFSAFTHSGDGDVSGYHGGADIWIVRIDMLGNIIWEQCYGGSRGEVAYNLFKTNNNDIIISGKTSSNDGDVSGNHSLSEYDDDIWLVKLNSEGELLSQQCIGGIGDERLDFGVLKRSDNRFVIAGRTDYGPSFDVECNPWGSPRIDYWVFEVFDTTVNISETTANQQLKVYPNPANNYIIFEFPVISGETTRGSDEKSPKHNPHKPPLITITNTLGQQIDQLKIKDTKTVWDTREVKPGVYMYQLEYKGAVKSGKVVVQH